MQDLWCSLAPSLCVCLPGVLDISGFQQPGWSLSKPCVGDKWQLSVSLLPCQLQRHKSGRCKRHLKGLWSGAWCCCQALTDFTLFSAEGPHRKKKLAAPWLQKCCSFVVPSHTWETQMRQSNLWEAGSYRGICARTGWAVCDSSVTCPCNTDSDLGNKHL